MNDEILADTCGGCAIGRRDFVVRSAMLAAAAALAACGVSDATGPQLNGSAQVNVNNFPSLANVGGVAVTSVQGTPIAIVRTGSSSFLALSRVCPHQGGTITTSGSGFRCPEHGATFNSSGTWTGGQRTSNMHAYQTQFDSQTGTLTIS
jgi:thiosulfate dehydrogenase [quinone] large subunit